MPIAWCCSCVHEGAIYQIRASARFYKKFKYVHTLYIQAQCKICFLAVHASKAAFVRGDYSWQILTKGTGGRGASARCWILRFFCSANVESSGDATSISDLLVYNKLLRKTTLEGYIRIIHPSFLISHKFAAVVPSCLEQSSISFSHAESFHDSGGY